jgi:hypothetical protein
LHHTDFVTNFDLGSFGQNGRAMSGARRSVEIIAISPNGFVLPKRGARGRKIGRL